jgi:membrane protein implicated in regulation of membrane protease activity
MNGREDMNRSQGGRFQWGSFGFLAGVLLGVLMGWFFAGFVGAFIRVAMVALIIVPVVFAYLAWRKFIAPWLRPPAERHYVGPVNAIETRAVVHGTVPDPRTR